MNRFDSKNKSIKAGLPASTRYTPVSTEEKLPGDYWYDFTLDNPITTVCGKGVCYG